MPPKSRPLATEQGDVYEVFAKFLEDDPFHHVGRVVAPDIELARTYAYSLYQEVRWYDLIIAKRRDMQQVIEVP